MRPRKVPKGEKPQDTIKTMQRTIDDLCDRIDVLSGRLLSAQRENTELAARFARYREADRDSNTRLSSSIFGA